MSSTKGDGVATNDPLTMRLKLFTPDFAWSTLCCSAFCKSCLVCAGCILFQLLQGDFNCSSQKMTKYWKVRWLMTEEYAWPFNGLKRPPCGLHAGFAICFKIWLLNLYFSRRDCLYFDFLTCSLYFSSIVADLDLWWLNTLYPKVQISMKTSSKALTIQTKQDKQSYLMFCPCGKCLLEAILFIGPCIALIKGENRNGKLFLYLYL